MSYKELFSKSLAADPTRLHFAAHSHHLWPDASLDGQINAWDDAARLADRKWDKVLGEIWPAAQAEVADELGTFEPDSIVFASNTHELLVRLCGALSPNRRVRVLTSDGEFHSARRQFARWQEAQLMSVDYIPVEPFESFSDRFVQAAAQGGHDLIFVSQVMFGSGFIFDRVADLAALARASAPWVVIDGYHAFMAIPQQFAGARERVDADATLDAGSRKSAARLPAADEHPTGAFYLGGGYKYAMSGEGCAFMHVPSNTGLRPLITGWFAEFEDLSLPAGAVGYAPDARRFLGATFDPSALYRFVAVRRMLREHGLTTSLVSNYVGGLQQMLVEGCDSTALGAAELLNPISCGPHARFLAFRSPRAAAWHEALIASNCNTDVRGDVLRIGFGLYHDQADVERLISLLGGLA